MGMNPDQIRALLNEPSTELAKRVEAKLLTCEEILKEKEINLYDISPRVAQLTIKYDLKGRTAGIAEYPRTIRINLSLLQDERYQLDMIDNTVPHEYVHIIAHSIAASKGIREPHHGALWQYIMVKLGLKPTRCHNYETIPARKRDQTRYNYYCYCRNHQVSSVIHNKVQKRGLNYYCKLCGHDLVWSGQATTTDPVEDFC